MAYTTLIRPAELQEHLDDPEWLVLDCRYELAEPGAGATAYMQGHIPGACYAHLDNHLASLPGPDTGRHPLPDPTDLALWLGRRGLRRGMQAVAYDASGGMFAARLWFLLRWLGHREVAVLEGGWQRWLKEGRPVEERTREPPPETFEADRDDSLLCGTGEIEDLVSGGTGTCLIDARSHERFRGEEEPIDPVAGHVPGARNLPFQELIDDEGQLLPASDLAERFRDRLGGSKPEEVVHMCGSGVSACLNLLAMEHAGLTGSRLYPGSWSEWIRDPEHPIAVGEE